MDARDWSGKGGDGASEGAKAMGMKRRIAERFWLGEVWDRVKVKGSPKS
jgi:hypothetical protein